MSEAIPFKRGMHGYATLLKSVIDEPQTSRELAEKHSVLLPAVNNLMRWLHKRGLTHVSAWRRVANDVFPREVWAFGAGSDAAVPPTSDGAPRVRVVSKSSPPMKSQAFTFCLLIEALQEGHSVIALCELLGLHRRGTDMLITHMRALRLIHIGEWHQGSGSPAPVWRLGDKRNRDRPRPMSLVEINRKYRIRRAARDKLAHIQQFITSPMSAHF